MMKKNACSVCFTNCVRLHGSVDDDEDDKMGPLCSSGGTKEIATSGPYPSFIKKMTESAMTSVLQMPTLFVRSFATRIGKTVTLEGPSKEKWIVEVGGSLQNLRVELRDGWRKFVGDHILQIGDQLSFTLTANSYLQVVVYDESGSQKASAIDATNSPTTPRQSKANEIQNGAVNNRIRSNGPVARPKQKVRRKPIGTPAAKPSVKQVVHVVHSGESELRSNELPKDHTELTEAASKEKLQNQITRQPSSDERRLLPPHRIVGGHVDSQRRPITDEEKSEALEAAKALSVPNPSILIIMSRAYVYRGFWLAPRRQFSKEHLPSETREVTLMNKAGHQWPVKWLYKDTLQGTISSGFSGGWRAFALDHRLEEFDACVFEVVDGANFVLLVHIFRVLGVLVKMLATTALLLLELEGLNRKSARRKILMISS